MNARTRNEALVAAGAERDGAEPGRGREEDRSPAAAPEGAAAESNWTGFLSGVAQFLRPRASLPREAVAEALLKNTGDGGFSAAERAMLVNILKLRDLRAADVMIPRAEICAVPVDSSLGDLMLAFRRAGHSRLPAFGADLDDPRGMVHIRDVLLHVVGAGSPDGGGDDDETPPDLSRISLAEPIEALGLLRTVLFVPPSMLASDLMARMQATRTQLALVIDEYGGTDGLVTLEDIVERVVGDIEDEHDDEGASVRADGLGGFEADARASLGEVREAVGADFDTAAHEADADTIGGLIFAALGRVPQPGETVAAVPGFLLEVLDADPRRLKRVRIRRVDGAGLDRSAAVH